MIKKIFGFFLLTMVLSIHAQSQEQHTLEVYLVVREVNIDPTALVNIDKELSDPAPARCYRVYACLSDSLWELQAVYYPGDEKEIRLTSTTSKFYQHPLINNLIGSSINPAFYAVYPELKYDSWFSINAENNETAVNLNVVESGPGPQTSDPPLPFTAWNSTGQNLVIDSLTSIHGSTIINIASPPTTSGMPDKNGEILIGQFTTDGDISGVLNLQFRKLADADGNVFRPVYSIKLTGLEFSNKTSPMACGVHGEIKRKK